MPHPISAALLLPFAAAALVTKGGVVLAESGNGVLNGQTLVPLAWFAASFVPTVVFVWWIANQLNKFRERQDRDTRRSKRAFLLAREAVEQSPQIDHTKGEMRALIVEEECEIEPTKKRTASEILRAKDT